MADTVTGLTAARMQEIEDSMLVDAEVVGDNLIFTRHDTTTFNAGNVRGAVGPMNPDGNPVGAIIMGGWASEPTGYLFLEGGFIANGAIAFSDLAGVYPEWVVGSDLQLPNAADSVPMQATSLFGTVAGSMEHVLTIPQLPSHTHTGPSHTHTGPSHTHTFSGTSGTHSSDHSHAYSGTTSTNGAHSHNYTYGYGQAGSQAPVGAGVSWFFLYTNNSTDTQGSHAHTFSGGTGGVSANHTHGYSGTTAASGTGVTGASGTDVTGSTGTGAAVNHTPKHLKVRFAVKY